MNFDAVRHRFKPLTEAEIREILKKYTPWDANGDGYGDRTKDDQPPSTEQ